MTELSQRISELLEITFTNSDEITRKQAEQLLSQLSIDFRAMIESLLLLCRSEISHNIRQSSAAYLRHLIENLTSSKVLQVSDICSIAEALISLMILDIGQPIRIAVSLSLLLLLTEDTHGILQTKVSILSTQYLQGSSTQVETGLLCIEMLFGKISNELSTKELAPKLMPHLIETGTRHTMDFFSAWELGSLDAMLYNSKVLTLWGKCLSVILDHFEVVSPRFLRTLLKQDDLAELFLRILSIKVHPDYVVIIENTEVNREITYAKTNVLKCLNVMMQCVVDNKKKIIEEGENKVKIATLVGVELPETPFVTLTCTIIESLLNTVLQISFENQLGEMHDNCFVNFIIESLKLFIICCGQSKFFTIFAEKYKVLLSSFIPNAISLIDSDSEWIAFNPDEFVNMGIDICDRQEVATIKTLSAKLLEIICDNIDGSLSYLLSMIIETFKAVLGYKSIDANFTFTEEKSIDTSLLMLCTVTYSISRRSDLLSAIETLLIGYFDVLSTVRSEIIQSRLCLFLYYFSEFLHINTEDMLAKWYFYLMKCISPLNPYKAGSLQACESLSSMTQDEEQMMRIKRYLPQIFRQLLDYIPHQNDKCFFEAVHEFINWYSNMTTEETEQLITTLVDRMVQEVGKMQVKEDNNIITTKCWSIIRKVISSKFLDAVNIGKFEALITPLIQMLRFSEKDGVKEEIFIMFLSIMRKTKSISKAQWEVFSMIQNFQQQQEGSLQILLKLINSYITYGKSYLEDHPHLLSDLVSIASLALRSTKSSLIKESYNSEGAILFQLLLMHFPGYLDNHLEFILSQTLSRYNSPVIQNHFLKVRLLDVILYSFYYNTSLACAILSRNQTPSGASYLEYSLQELIQNSLFFYQAFDKKTVVLGLTHLFLNGSLPNGMNDFAGNLIEMMVIVLSPNEKRKATLNELFDRIGDNDTDLEENEILVRGTRLMFKEGNEHNTEETEASLTIRQVLSPLNDFDEISAFKKFMTTLHKHNPQWITAVIAGLSETRKEELISIIQSQKVRLDVPGSTEAVRKILKAKRD